jgi:Ca-activated chloride channel homolog
MFNKPLWVRILSLFIFLSFLPNFANLMLAQNQTPPEGAIVITILYPPEFKRFMPEVIDHFNEEYRQGNDPITGEKLANGTKPIFVVGYDRSSGRVMDDVVAYMQTGSIPEDDPFYSVTAPELRNRPPTIWIPAVGHWLDLANQLVGAKVYNRDPQDSIAKTAVVIAIWKDRLDLFAPQVNKAPEDVTFTDLLHLLQNGWDEYDLEDEIGHSNVYYGRTNPFVSSTGLSMSMLEVYTCALDLGIARSTLAETLQLIDEPALQECLSAFQNSIVFANRTTEFVEQIAEEGPGFVDFASMSEDDFLRITTDAIWDTESELSGGEKLVAIYPPEGTFWADYPFAIPIINDWIDDPPNQRPAADRFMAYLLSDFVQEKVLASGFRPVNPNISLTSIGSLYRYETQGQEGWNQNGIIPQGPERVFNDPTSADLPEPQILEIVQRDWCAVKKRAYIYLVIDASESMIQENKIRRVIEAVETFLNDVDDKDYVGLVVFSSGVLDRFSVELAQVNQNRQVILGRMEDIQAFVDSGDGGGSGLFGSTALFAASIQAFEGLETIDIDNITRTIILLSDGEDNLSGEGTDAALIQQLHDSSTSPNPIMLVPIDYSDSDSISEPLLFNLAEASGTKVADSSPDKIKDIFSQIGGSFATSSRCP